MDQIRFTLSWIEDISAEPFAELCALSRRYREAKRLAAEAEHEYHKHARAIARPLIDAKLGAIGATLEGYGRSRVQMMNEGFANPQPRLTITVSNEPDPGSVAVYDCV